MSFSTTVSDQDVYDEFCRECGVTVSWTGEDWVHDYEPEEGHDPVVPWDPYDD